MHEWIELMPGSWWTTLFVLARISGIVALMPAMAGRQVSFVMRIAMAVSLTALLAPVCDAYADVSVVNAEWLPMLLHEVAVGLLLGTGVHLLVFGVQVGGQLASQMGGISLAGVYSGDQAGSGEMVSPLTRLLDLLTIAVFLTIGGHRWVLGGLLDTFANWPPGTAALQSSTWQVITDLLGQSFLLGIEAALPLLVTLFVSNVLAGILGRLMPQLNVLVMSSGLNALLTMAAVLVGVGSVAWALENHLEPFVTQVTRLCGGA